MSRKRAAVRFFGLALCFLLGGGCGPRELSEGTVITFLYSNDVRGRLEGCGCERKAGGVTRRSAAIAAMRAENPATVYCDAGNFLMGTPETDSTRGMISIQAYNHMKATVANVSELELAAGVLEFRALRKAAKFPFVSANVAYNGSLLVDPYVVRNIHGARIAFIGLCGTKDVMRSDSLVLPAGVTIGDPIHAAGKAVQALTGKVDVIVVLSTCGDAVDSLLARTYPSLDLIIGGRSFRNNATAPWVINKTRIVRAQRHGQTLGRMDVVFGADRQIKTLVPKELTLERAEQSDAEMLALIQKYIPSFADDATGGVRIGAAPAAK